MFQGIILYRESEQADFKIQVVPLFEPLPPTSKKKKSLKQSYDSYIKLDPSFSLDSWYSLLTVTQG